MAMKLSAIFEVFCFCFFHEPRYQPHEHKDKTHPNGRDLCNRFFTNPPKQLLNIWRKLFFQQTCNILGFCNVLSFIRAFCIYIILFAPELFASVIIFDVTLLFKKHQTIFTFQKFPNPVSSLATSELMNTSFHLRWFLRHLACFIPFLTQNTLQQYSGTRITWSLSFQIIIKCLHIISLQLLFWARFTKLLRIRTKNFLYAWLQTCWNNPTDTGFSCRKKRHHKLGWRKNTFYNNIRKAIY